MSFYLCSFVLLDKESGKQSPIKMLLWTDGFHQLLVPFPALRGDSLAFDAVDLFGAVSGEQAQKIKLCSQVTHADVTKPILRD